MPLSRAPAAAMINIMQLCNNCLCDYMRSRICKANAHRNHLPRRFHGCELECASAPMLIRVWTFECALQVLCEQAFSLYISFIQANSQSISASTMYAIQSNANSCMPSAHLVCSGSPPRCCRHLLSGYWCTGVDESTQYGRSTHVSTATGVVDYECRTA